jgi:hypothetical protein
VKSVCLAITMLSLAVSMPGRAAETNGCADGIFVIGSLHALHAKSSAFGYARLRQLLDDIAPGVMLVEVTPEELKTRGGTKGRPEHPEVVWPFLRAHRSKAEALEPASQQYKRLLDASSDILADVKREQPDQATYWASYQKSLEAALLAYWTTPARTQDRVTSDLARSWYATQEAALGPAYASIQTQWNGGMAGRVKLAVKRFPSSRIVVLASYHNRHLIEEAARGAAPRRVQDVSRWLGPEAPVCKTINPPQE